ncbi:MAG: hypothetical protein OXN94_06445 [Chloroflexota bacterium]|nr:hypothetical protein [Chloroflexota bacterium]
MRQDAQRCRKQKQKFKPAQNPNASSLCEASYAHVATKADVADIRTEIANLRTELKTDNASLRTEVMSEIGSLRTEVTSEIGSLRTDMKNMRWMIGVMIAGVSVLVAGANLLVTLALRT